MKKYLVCCLFLCLVLTACGKEEPEPPAVSCEIVRETAEGGGYGDYPVFTVDGEGCEALAGALEAINRRERSQALAAAGDGFFQTAYADITRCDSLAVCLVVSRSVEQGGPHPNNYTEAFSLDPRTGEALRLADFLTIGGELEEAVWQQLLADYPELDFDEALTKRELTEALADENFLWYFWEDQISLSFPEGSFGFSHAEGSLGVLLSCR